MTAKEYVKKEIKKYGFDLAFHYFAYNCHFSNMSNWDKKCFKAFDKQYRKGGKK